MSSAPLQVLPGMSSAPLQVLKWAQSNFLPEQDSSERSPSRILEFPHSSLEEGFPAGQAQLCILPTSAN